MIATGEGCKSRSGTMSMTLAEIEAEAMKLSPEEREQLVDVLAASLDEKEMEIDPEMLVEARQRYEELRSGRVQGESLEEVLAHLRAPLG
jgi:putative addiction module component (TIGR02574 family)